ncbi:FSH1 domain-containing protein [Mycena indigotica]|uniref:FSH1 domain-containing protein n=1 Tax=Mycena indigotica TaxID=2126181 RepID=A0A8H6VSZ5_9AGAR|nr:FSH1 domain-containing protein [Mycena indigotica]KAF7292784.1 FSH1 domain-containing protein [Mycena indigotica]
MPARAARGLLTTCSETTMATTTVLALHGHFQNAAMYSKKLGALRKHCEKSVEFVFIDAPNVLQPVDMAGATSTEALEASATGGDARAWFNFDDSRNEAVGLPQSLETLRDVLKTRHFDGVIGFSQGAVVAGLLTALLERPEVYPDFLVDGKPPHPPFKFCIAVAGFRLRGAIGDAVYSQMYKTPTLHVLGRNDIIVIEERSRTLIAVSENARVEQHDGGHFLPSKTSWRKFVAAYIADPTGPVVSPSVSVSADNSGVVSPA